MTSLDFSYPHPTDDELTAQQPRNLGSHAPLIYSTPGSAVASGDMSASGSTLASGDAFESGDVSAAMGTDASTAKSPGLGKTALVLSIIAMALSIAASVLLGSTIGPAEAASGYYFTDIPDWYQTLAAVLVGLQGLCTCLGITGIILGITAAVAGRGRTPGTVAIALAAIAPFLSFGTFVALSLFSA